MAYLGNTPALNYISFAKQTFTIVNGQTSYTLDNSVANGLEILLYINNVKQVEGSGEAYTASGNTLTIASALTSGSDEMYCLFIGKAVQTVTPPNNSVTGDMLSKPFNYDSGTLYLDDTNNKVGILNTSPSFPLEVNGTVRAVGTNNLPALVVDGNSTNEGDIAVFDGATLTFGHHTLDGNTGSFTERMRIKPNGALQAKLNGASAETWTPAVDSHQLIGTDNNDVVVAIKADTSSYASNVIRALCNRSGNSGYSFLTCTSGNLSDDQFILRGEGNAYADGSWNGGGADYAEYFEWHDGNTSNEDRRGYTVVLDGNKIRKSTNEDNTNNIIGVISGNPSVVGDNDIGRWKNKYQKDDYGSHILDENGDKILNTEYDETQNYIGREDRQEWDIVGLMGKVRINKGQPVGDRWIKMRDISETVEEWLIR
jgi:hypothetical protein